MWCNWPAEQSNSVKKCKISAIIPFKVIKVVINRKPVCDFLLVINSNWHPISYHFRAIIAYCSNFGHFAFFEPPSGRLRDNVRCSSWAHWKACNGLPIHITWTFFARCYGRGATSEYRFKIGDFAPTGPFELEFQLEWVTPINQAFSQKTRLTYLSCCIKIWIYFSSFCHNSPFDRWTDRNLSRD